MNPRSYGSTSTTGRRRTLAALVLLGAAVAATLAGSRVVRAGGSGLDVPAIVLDLQGPDVTVIDLESVAHYGAAGGFRAYSLGTNACNSGDLPLNWCNENGEAGCGGETTHRDHPVIAQNLYRLKNGRFEQIGMSWLKHGFASTNDVDPECGECVQPPLVSDQLGVGCTDTYRASLNGSRPLARRSDVNAATGSFPYPFAEIAPANLTSQRIRVAESDVAPAQNPGARYWMEGHYVAPDDAAAGNAFNNASHREVTVAGNFELAFAGPTVRELPAIAAWPLVDPAVELVSVDVPGTWPAERFHVARKASRKAGGGWHYEYAVHNLNADRAARSFSVRFPGGATITNAGGRTIAHHSGERYDASPWASDLSAAGAVSWATATFAADRNANALRWGTVFSFWFDSTAGPSGIVHTLGLFKPGSPGEVEFGVPAGSAAAAEAPAAAGEPRTVVTIWSAARRR